MNRLVAGLVAGQVGVVRLLVKSANGSRAQYQVLLSLVVHVLSLLQRVCQTAKNLVLMRDLWRDAHLVLRLAGLNHLWGTAWLLRLEAESSLLLLLKSGLLSSQVL